MRRRTEHSRENRTSSRVLFFSTRCSKHNARQITAVPVKIRFLRALLLFLPFLSLIYTHIYTRTLCHPLGFHLVFARGSFYVLVIAIGHLRPPCASGDRKLQLYFRLSPIADLRIFAFYGRHTRWSGKERERKHRTSRFSRTRYHFAFYR